MQNSIPIPLHANSDELVRIALIAMIGENGERLPRRYVCKIMTVYKGGCGAEALNDNLPIRSSYFDDPGPATTGVPLPVLAYESMCIEIDIYAMAEPD